MLDYSNQQGWVNYQFFLYNWPLYSIIYHMPFAATFELWYIKLAIVGFNVDLWFLFSFPLTKNIWNTNKYPAYGWFKLFWGGDVVHNYNTRKSSTLSIPYCRTNTRLFSVNYQGPKFFNTLNPNIRNSSSIFSFQSKLRSFLFSRYI
jgi:hypothetical protein